MNKNLNTSFKIVPGRLYEYRGSVVRACKLTSNGRRHVSLHKQLHGFVKDSELNLISPRKVTAYLQK